MTHAVKRSAAGILIALLAMSGYAQEPVPTVPVESSEPDAAPPPATQETTVHLQEVVVTATRRRKSSRDVPVSIDAFDADELNARGAQGAQDALLYSPGASVNQYFSPNFTNVEIRGVATDTVNNIGGPPAGAFLDDVPLANPTFLGGNPNIDVYDLATIEVLKGPQGTLFGGSALAGALRSIPNPPELGAFGVGGFYARSGVSQSDGAADDFGAMLNVPIGSSLAARGIYVRREYPGAIDDLRDGLSDVDRYSARTWRAMLRWEPIENASLQAMYHDSKGAMKSLLFTDNPSTLDYSNQSGLSPSSWDYRILQVKAAYDFSAFSIQGSIARVRKDDALVLLADRHLGGQTPVTSIDSGPQMYVTDIRTEELRVVSKTRTSFGWSVLDDWEWLIGFFNYRADQDAATALTLTPVLPALPVTLPLPVVGGAQPERVTTNFVAREQALYFDLTRYVGDLFELNLGGRQFRQRSNGSSTTYVAGVPSAASGEHPAHGFNPKIALTWHATKELAWRAAATKGFRFGGININVDGDPNEPLFYDTDELWNYELGVRSDWLDRRLRVDVTGFYIDWSRVQIAQKSFTGLGTYILNIGSAISKGAELRTRAILPWGFSLSAGGAYVDSRTSSDFNGTKGAVPAGRRLPGTPFVTGSVALGYSKQAWRALLASALTWTYQGKAWNTLYQEKEIPSYQLVGLSIGASFADVVGQPYITLNATNLFDRRAYNGVLPPVNGADTAFDYFPIRPRVVMLTVGGRFRGAA